MFKKEVFDPIIYEKVYSRIVENITPNSENIRAAIKNLDFHIQYLNYLLNSKKYFIKDDLTCLDLLAGANFSVLDYLGLLNLNLPLSSTSNQKILLTIIFKRKFGKSFKNLFKAGSFPNQVDLPTSLLSNRTT